MTGDLVFFGVHRNDRETVSKSLVSHNGRPSAFQNVRQAAVDQLIDSLGEDAALIIDAEIELRQVVGGLTPGLPPAGPGNHRPDGTPANHAPTFKMDHLRGADQCSGKAAIDGSNSPLSGSDRRSFSTEKNCCASQTASPGR